MPDNNTNNNNNRRTYPEVWVLGSAFVLGMIAFGAGLRGCGCLKKVTVCDGCKDKTEIKVDGDAVIVKDSQNTDIKVNKGNNNVINDNASTINAAPKPKSKPKVKPKPKIEEIPVVDPIPEVKPEPKPEKKCKQVITYEEIVIEISRNGRGR